MTAGTQQIKHNFMEGMSGISQFWGFPKAMGAIFAALYLSPAPLSLDEIVEVTGITKGAISTNVRALSRMGLIHPISKMADRKDYYAVETDFYKAISVILKGRQNSEFDRAVNSAKETLSSLQNGEGNFEKKERAFLIERLTALCDFFDAIDGLTRAISKLDNLGINTLQSVMKILK
jgi:DNA-binding transcriptional regulator GbsR (MarR family)